MAEGLILEFDGVTRAEYEAVNAALGMDLAAGSTQNWPDGLTYHAGGAKPGGWVVFEVWESREAQGAFMSGRLGRALQESGIAGPPARVEWVDLASAVSRG